ncbi:MAG: hypothetical protein M1597_01805 [Candidatus Thermoplasmatota archaeon]|nr:hypothetical protein [Candidatus Thermoplasmatota archaeon]
MAGPNKSANNDVLVVRKINKEIYKQFRQKAMEENKNVGEALNQAMNYWLAKEREHERPDIKKMLKLNGLVKTSGKVSWSVNVDEILYGDLY